jgi:hypothetical protein
LRFSRAMRCDSLRSIIEITPRRTAPFENRRQGEGRTMRSSPGGKVLFY